MDDYLGDGLDLDGIDWLIVGGESGAGHRPLDLGWVRDLRDQCAAAATFDGERHQHTAFFVKQLGGARPGTKLEDLPEDLRIREFPRQQEVTHA
jgi:protein gp37